MAGKKKSSLLHSIWNFLTFIFNATRWIAEKLWALGVWLFRLFKSAEKSREIAEIEKKRPKAEATYAPLENIEAPELEKFETKLYAGKSLIGLILGSRGSGKSALGMRILENVVAKTGRHAYCMGFRREDLPGWIGPVESLDEVKNNSFLLVDEGGIKFSSRSAMSSANKLLSELLLISRHKDLNVLFITQNSSNIEVNAIRQSDYLLLKTPSLLQLDFERKAIRDIYGRVKEGFRKHQTERGLAYIYSDSCAGFASNRLPSFWSESVSKSFKDKK